MVTRLRLRRLDDALPGPQPHVDEHVAVDQVDLGDLLVDHPPIVTKMPMFNAT
jgi:hypothetical protein